MEPKQHYEPGEHHEKKSPFPLTAEALQPPKSKDAILVHYEDGTSHLRSTQAGRDIYCYTVTNTTKNHAYQVELLEDARGLPHGWCNCAASVVCKHIKTALQRLREDYPEFGASTLPRRPTVQEAAMAALKMLTGSEREYAVVDYPARPNYTICDMLREALGQPPQDRSDW
jgi:hypothetical protein